MITGYIQTKAGKIPVVSTRLTFKDKFGAMKVRWLIGRNNYRVDPGLYAAGYPDELSDVFVTANYKLSFDHLRKNLDGLNAWILVLDTKGVNVWCAAGKGTFGTYELVNRINKTGLDILIHHRRIIVPQLGATGISAWQVKQITSTSNRGKLQRNETFFSNLSFKNELKIQPEKGFNVIFGPVRASDIRRFIESGYKSTEDMRKVHFNFIDRLKLIPVDIVYAKYKLITAFAVIFFLSGLTGTGFSFTGACDKGFPAMFYITLAYITGIIATPLLLPYLPFRMFSFKGLITGFLLSLILLITGHLGQSRIEAAAWFFLLPAVSSFMAMNFTGASTFTSLSGVKKEMKVFVPVQIILVFIGLIVLVISNFNSQ